MREVPYRQPSSGIDYNQLMQMIALKQMMERQGQQAQPQSPSKSGISNLMSSFGGGAAGGGIGNMMGDSGAFGGAQGVTDALAGTTMPSVGPTITNAAALPGVDTLGLSGMGSLPMAAGVLGAGMYLNNIYEGGGKDILRGKGKGEDYANLLLDVNPVTAPINMGLRLFGQKSVGRMLSGDKDKWQTEGNRLSALEKKGINVPDALKSGMPTKGRSKDQLIQLEQDKINKGQYGNVDFAKSRNEKDLKAEDIWGYSAFLDKYGNDWLGKFSEQERRNIANNALAKGAVNEHHGTIDIDWNKLDQNSTPQNPTMGRGGALGAVKVVPQGDNFKLLGNPVRSNTRSPGIDKNGRRIKY